MKEENRGPWYLFTGLVLGVVAGLLYAWIGAPVEYVDTAPASLRADFKNHYRALIAVAFTASGDLERAQARLSLLQDGDSASELEAQVQGAAAEGRSESEIRAMTLLAAALKGLDAPNFADTPLPSPTGQITPTLTPTPLLVLTSTLPVETATSEPGMPRPRGTFTPTATPVPSRTPTLTPGAAFVLQNQELVCDISTGEALIQVTVADAAGQPVPGVQIVVSWDGQEDYFVTGLKPEFGAGYADFKMTPGVTYQVRLRAGGQSPDLTPTECEGPVGRFWGNWRLDFIQP